MMEIALVLALFGILILGGVVIFLLLRRGADSDPDNAMVDINQTLGGILARLDLLDTLTERANSLEDMLSNSQKRGSYGEIQLKDLVTDALPKERYAFQHTLSNKTRVDCLMRLPNPPGPIAIDSKYSLKAWQELGRAKTKDETNSARKRLAADIIKEMNEIADKYIIPGETAECALMFLPLESIHTEIHANLPNVLEESRKKRVYIVSPTTMMAILTTVRAIFQDVKIRKEANNIKKEVGSLLKNIRLLNERVGELDKHFNKATGFINDINITTGKINNHGERIVSIEVKDATDPPSA